MYKFIKILFHINPGFSHVAYLYQDINTKKFYLSHTDPNSEDIINNSNEYMLINSKPKIIHQEFLKNITKDAEVTQEHFKLKFINNYVL